jgi:hypothetical protein
MGLSHLPAGELAAWVEASCAAQGLPARVTDGLVLRQVVVLLGGAAEGPRALQRSASARPAAPRSKSPHGLHTVRIQAAGSGSAGSDDGVVEQGADDGMLAVEVESGPLSA